VVASAAGLGPTNVEHREVTSHAAPFVPSQHRGGIDDRHDSSGIVVGPSELATAGINNLIVWNSHSGSEYESRWSHRLP
jgi:hypothetical protein